MQPINYNEIKKKENFDVNSDGQFDRENGEHDFDKVADFFKSGNSNPFDSDKFYRFEQNDQDQPTRDEK